MGEASTNNRDHLMTRPVNRVVVTRAGSISSFNYGYIHSASSPIGFQACNESSPTAVYMCEDLAMDSGGVTPSKCGNAE